MNDIPESDDASFEIESGADNFVTLSHLNNKSSVLRPDSQDITGQYIVLQQLNAHHRMVSRAKSIVDTSAPKSLQSYISVTDRQRKKSWRKPPKEVIPSNFRGINETYRVSPSLRLHTPFSEEDENASLNASSMNKGVQTGIPFAAFNSKTADKISWYLEALSQGELHSEPFICTEGSRNISRQSDQMSANRTRKKVVMGDIIDSHQGCFIKPRKAFSPRILADTTAKSKVKDMRCYNPPFRRKKNNSSHSSDTFESYDSKDESNDEEAEEQRSSYTSSIEDETQMNRAHSSENNRSIKTTHQSPPFQHIRDQYFDSFSNSRILSSSEEDTYLNFLGKVTEDILRSGVYSDRAIQQAFEFHMQFHQDENNKEKLQSLLNQVLDGLKISSEESVDIPSRRNTLFNLLSRPNSPPQKENPDVVSTYDESLRPEAELNSRVTEEPNLNLHALNLTDISQSTPQDNLLTPNDDS